MVVPGRVRVLTVGPTVSWKFSGVGVGVIVGVRVLVGVDVLEGTDVGVYVCSTVGDVVGDPVGVAVALGRLMVLCTYQCVWSSDASTSRPVELLSCCLVEVTLLVLGSLLNWIKGVPNPAGKEILSSGACL